MRCTVPSAPEGVMSDSSRAGEYTMYAFADKGVAATATLNLLYVTRNRSLNKK